MDYSSGRYSTRGEYDGVYTLTMTIHSLATTKMKYSYLPWKVQHFQPFSYATLPAFLR